jgi:hypothetical protein
MPRPVGELWHAFPLTKSGLEHHVTTKDNAVTSRWVRPLGFAAGYA